MKPPGSLFFLLILQVSLTSSGSATPVTAQLAAVNEPDFNQITLEFEPPVLPNGEGTSTLSGAIEVLLEIDPATDQVSEMTIVDGEIEGSPVEISESSFLGSYDLESSTLGASLATLDPPGLVDPNSGEFDSSQHSFTVTSGTLGGNISAPLLGLDEDLTFDFAELPVGGTGFGTGTVTLTPTGATPTSKSYEVVVLLPIAVEQTVEAEGFEIPIRANGTAKLVGPATIEIEPEDPFVAWTEQNGIAGATQLEDANGDGVPNGLQWALGLDASDSPFPHLLRPDRTTAATVDFTLALPDGGTGAPLTVVTTTDLELPFNVLDPASVSSGNPIPQGTTGSVTIALPRGERGFVQLVVGAGN
ncbi:MAG: hypothetical protein VCA40_15740 [Roseibacillus sp.]